MYEIHNLNCYVGNSKKRIAQINEIQDLKQKNLYFIILKLNI